MWLYTSPKVVYTGATVASLVGIDLLSKAINVSLLGLQFTSAFLSSGNSDNTIKKYQEKIEILDLDLKLKLVESWLKHIDMDKIKSDPSLELIYGSVSDSCHKIADCINKINQKIEYHHTKWFYTWRNIYLDDDISQLDKNARILDERITLLNLLKN